MSALPRRQFLTLAAGGTGAAALAGLLAACGGSGSGTQPTTSGDRKSVV